MVLLQLIVGLVASVAVSRFTGLNFFYAAAIVAIAWIMFRGGGGAPAVGTGGGLGGWLTRTFTTTFGFFERLLVGTLVFLGTIMLMARFVGVSPAKVATALGAYGAPWNWPSDFRLPFLMFVCGSFLLAGVAMLATHGRYKPALIIFGVGFVVIFGITYLPKTMATVAPTTMEDIDKTLSDAYNKGGVVGASASAVGKVSLGEITQKKGVIKKAWWAFRMWGWGEPPEKKPASSSTPVATPTPTRVAKVVQLPDCATPCIMEIAEIRDLYTDGEAVMILPPGWSRDRAIPYSGKGHLVLSGGNIPPGAWEFWSSDPSKVVMIRVFGK